MSGGGILMPSSLYTYDAVTKTWRAPGRNPISTTPGGEPEEPTTLPSWSDTNLPWAYTSTSVFTENWPPGQTIVDIQTGSSDFYTNLANTVNAAPGRVVVRLGVGVYHLNQFRMIGSSGKSTYAFGFWFPKLQGFLGQGADKSIIQMDANSVSSQQLADMAAMDPNEFVPSQMGFCRIDGTDPAKPVLIAGVTFRAADQQMLTQKHPNLPSVVPQPAPHQGVAIYAGAYGVVSHVRFQGAGRALNSSPPFETANITSQYATIKWFNCEFDGRRSPALDPARPRRCGVWMGNNETLSEFDDCWFHHSNVSRYAANDENRNTTGEYIINRCVSQQITNTQNTDPALNNGASLGGYTNASNFGWESVSGTITLNDCVVYVDNQYTNGQWPAHLQLTSTGSRNPQGGRMYVNGGRFRHTKFSQIDEFVTVRIQQSTYWWIDGFNTTLNIKHRDGQRLLPYQYTGSWPVSAQTLANAGVTPATHYIIKNA
jgi:hypothetical protein